MDKEYNALLLAGLIKFPDLRQRASAVTDGRPLFDNAMDPSAAYMWSVLCEVTAHFQNDPDLGVLQAELKSRESTIKGGRLKGLVAGSLALLDEMRMYSEMGVDKKTAEKLLTHTLRTVMQVGWVSEMSKLKDMSSMRDFVLRVSRDESKLTASDESVHFPLMNPEDYLTDVKRTPTGLRFVDELLGGGTSPGEIIGILGPSGGGKTVLATGLVCEAARRQRKAMLVTCEQTIAGDIMQRICCYMTRMSIDTFRGKKRSDWTSEQQDRYSAEAKPCEKFLAVADFAKGNAGRSGVSDIVSRVSHLRDNEDFIPELIVVDWLGALVERTDNGRAMELKDKYRSFVPEIMDTLGRVAQQCGAVVFLLHQLSTDMQRAPSSRKPNATQAHECRSIAQKMNACLCLGTLDSKSRVGWLVADKNRGAPYNEMKIRLDGEHMRFDDVSGDYITDYRGAWVRKDEDDSTGSTPYKSAYGSNGKP